MARVEEWWPPPPAQPVKRRAPSRRRKKDCMDCGVDTSFATGVGHHYTVHDALWLAAAPGSRGQLCLDCLEARLGRRLTADDFVATPFEIMAWMSGEDDAAEAALRARGTDG